MAKWADYGVSAVRFNSAHTHIDRLRVHVDSGESIGVSVDKTRADIVSAIKNGTTFVTIIKKSEGNWGKGQPIYIIKLNGTEYLKTVDNGKAADNLDNLPEF